MPNPYEPTARVPLGRSGLPVTRLGLGLAPVGGLYAEVGAEAATATVDAAWDAGIRLYDTAPLYGAGLSETRSGEALRKRPRDEYVLCTKVGRQLVPGTEGQQEAWAEDTGLVPVFDYGYDGVMRSLEASLTRLGLDRVDVLHIHDPDDHWDEAISGAALALRELREQGVIGAVSAGMNQAEMLTRFVRAGAVDCVLLAGRYTLLDQTGLDELLPLCGEENIGVILGGVYNSGLLADPSEDARYDYATVDAGTLTKARAMQDLCARYDVPLRAAALRFSLAHPAVSAIVVGARSPEEVTDNVAMARHDIPAELWSDLHRAGLLGEKAPVP